MDVGPIEILVILAVVVMIFGVGKLPEVGSALGKGIREFRNASNEDDGAPKAEESKAESTEQPGGLSCAVCGAPNIATSCFCTNCGRPMAAMPEESKPEPSVMAGSVDCPTCGAPNTGTVRFCTNCGRPMMPIAET